MTTLDIVNISSLSLLMLMNITRIFPLTFINIVFSYFFIDFFKQIYQKNTSVILHHIASLYLFYVTFYHNQCYECINQMTNIEISSLLLLIYRKTKFVHLKYITFVVWIYQRLFYLPFVLYSISQKNLYLLYTHPHVYILSYISLSSIQILSLYWTYLILRKIFY